MNAFSPLVDTISVLHVDDEPDLAALTATFLKREDDRFEVTTATSTSEAIAHFDENTFDCIVSDYDMPGLNGLDFLEIVREENPDLPFILFTGKGSEEVASDAISAGVTDHLQKESGTGQYIVLTNRIINAVEHYRSYKLLEQSEEHLREIINAVPHILYIVDSDGTFLLANEALATFHHTTVGEIEGANITDILADSIADQLHRNIVDVLQSGTQKRISEVAVSNGNGVEHTFAPRLLPYEFSNLDKQTILGYAVDMTEHQQRECGL